MQLFFFAKQILFILIIWKAWQFQLLLPTEEESSKKRKFSHSQFFFPIHYSPMHTSYLSFFVDQRIFWACKKYTKRFGCRTWIIFIGMAYLMSFVYGMMYLLHEMEHLIFWMNYHHHKESKNCIFI